MADSVCWSRRQRVYIPLYACIAGAPSLGYPLTPHQSQYLPALLLADDSATPQAAQIAAGEQGLWPYSRRARLRHAAPRCGAHTHSTVTHESPECSGRIAVVFMHDLASPLLPDQAEGRHDERCSKAASSSNNVWGHASSTTHWSSIRLPV